MPCKDLLSKKAEAALLISNKVELRTRNNNGKKRTLF